MKTFRGYFIAGIVVGGVLAIIGIYTKSTPLRLLGVAFPLAGIGLGLALDRDHRARRDRR